jgi:hypothetical protein
MDMGAGDGRFVLARAAERPDELVLAIDASHAAMRESSWRAGRSPRRGGLQNALFIASSLDALPAELSGLSSSLVTVHFPWGSLLQAVLGRDEQGADRLARLVGQGGLLRLLVSASERDAVGGAVELDPAEIAATYEPRGFVVEQCRPATLDDVNAARSSWGRRLLAGAGNRAAWLIELRHVESAHGEGPQGRLPRVRS